MVCVSTSRTGESELCVSVSDNGSGIDEKVQERLLELFRTSKPGKGAGLGLPTVAAIAEKINGRLEIESELGKGATFRLLLREDIAVA